MTYTEISPTLLPSPPTAREHPVKAWTRGQEYNRAGACGWQEIARQEAWEARHYADMQCPALACMRQHSSSVAYANARQHLWRLLNG